MYIKLELRMKTNNDFVPDENTIHIGHSVKQELSRQGRSARWLAEQVHCTPENIYKIFRQQWVNMPLLFKISGVLHHDFFKECSEYLALGAKEK